MTTIASCDDTGEILRYEPPEYSDLVNQPRDDGPITRSVVRRPQRPRIAVLGGGAVTTYPVPTSGVVVVGRGDECDVRIDDPSVSRRHAVIRVASGNPDLTIEDLGSSNGTTVRGATIAPNTAVGFAYDEVVNVGAIGIVVQRNATASHQRTLWGHGYFELRLAEECTRAERAGGKFGLLRVRAMGDGGSTADDLGAAVRDVDVVGTYAPNEWEVLLIDVAPDAARRIADQVRHALPSAKVGLATFPADGGDAWSLASAAAARLVGAPRAETVDGEHLINPVGPMRAILDLVEKVALGEISTLIFGETGVGKEVVAELIHRKSARAEKPLLKLNCAALPEQLLESELFGYERGAFTGATASKPGLLEQADGGSVFLDEIGELAPVTQAKLLRVLEQREFLRVGALKPKAIDVRFISATHRDLEAAIAAGRFREDLYFRLAGVTLQVPPLRHRPDELGPLIDRFVARSARALGRPPPAIAPAAMALLRAYRWPGNVRELRNALERATLLCDGIIEPRYLPEDRMSRPAAAAGHAASDGGVLDNVREQADALERQAIEDALAQTQGNQTAAARILGISRRTLTNKLNLYGFDRPRKGR
jgi:DNA-binding NtrC family response regulator